MVMPWKHIYDNIIVHHMMKQYIHFTDNNSKQIASGKYFPTIGRWISFIYTPQSVSELYRAIRNPDKLRPEGNPEITREVLLQHLDELVKRRILVRLTKYASQRWVSGRYRWTKKPYRKEALYRLNPSQLYVYFDYLLILLTNVHGRNVSSTQDKDTVISEVLGVPRKFSFVHNPDSPIVYSDRRSLIK
jgi:DNA-binding HxlR family transcriptional regulator